MAARGAAAGSVLRGEGWRSVLRHPAAPTTTAALIALAWLAATPGTADMAAHTYRAWLWDAHGFTVWNAQWYGGHHVPGYSLLFPPLASVFGAYAAVSLAGALAGGALVALTREWGKKGPTGTFGAAHSAAAWLAASAAATNLVVGRGPFVLGVAFAALALIAVARRRPLPAAAAALAAVWASPVAGLFLALVLAAHLAAARTTSASGGREPSLDAPNRATAVALAAALLGGAAMTLPFPEGGAERFVATAFWPMLAVTVAAAALIDARHRAIRVAAAGYVLLLVAAFVIDTPLGQNATRLGTLAGPVVLALAGRGPRAALLVTGAALLYLQWLPAVRAITESRGDLSARAEFHEPLIEFLDAFAAPGDRVEIPLTRNHWEASHVARRWAIARGWERQLDVERNALFYDAAPLSAQRYQAWLRAENIRWVALPAGVALDFSARAEAALIRSRPPFLSFRERLANWEIYEYPAARQEPIRAAAPDALTIRATAAGPIRLARRHTRYWRVTSGRGCIRAAAGNWIEVQPQEPGLVRLEARVSGPACR